MATGASYAAPAADEPPPEPPGVRVRSHGLWLGPKAECSVDEPMANSSMLVLPRTTMPAARILSTIVASYGGRHPSRIRDPAVVGTPRVTMTSLQASGTPASGPLTSPASTRRACASAPSASTCRNACTPSSTAAIRSRWACATSTADSSPPAMRAARSAADIRTMSSLTVLPPHCAAASLGVPEDLRDAEATVLGLRRSGQGSLGSERRRRLVGTEHVGQRQGVRRGRDVSGSDLLHPRHCAEDDVELAGELVELVVGHRDAGEPRKMGDVVAGDRGHVAILGMACRPEGAQARALRRSW